MTLGYILFIVLPIAAFGYIVWDFRRKTAQRAAMSAGRLTELMGVAQQVQQQPPAQSELQAQPQSQSQPLQSSTVERAASALTSIPAAPAPATTPQPEAPADAPLYARRARVLDPAQTLVYLLLKTGLPDHVVFARVSLASVLEAGPALSGIARDEQARRLATLTVDFVVADRSMHPVAVVEIAAPDQGGAAQADRSSTRTRLAAAGVRYIELDARALPRKEGIRSVVLDEAPAGAA